MSTADNTATEKQAPIRLTIDFLPVRLHVRPHQKLQPLHESVIAGPARHGVRQILPQSSGLQASEN